MLTVPLISKSGLWYALYQKGDSNLQQEIYVGFWGVCSYDLDVKTHEIQNESCTSISLAYSFKLFNHRFDEHKTPNQTSGLEINATQTTVLLWYPIVSILILMGISLSTSNQLKNIKRSLICYFMSSLITFSVYSGTFMIFLDFKNQFLNTQLSTQTQDLIPIEEQILFLTHLPLLSGSLLFVNSLIGLIRYKNLKTLPDQEITRDEESKLARLGHGRFVHPFGLHQSSTLNELQFIDEKIEKEGIDIQIHHPSVPPAYYPSKSSE
ncbi:uncharacterized protein MELLADRAFT_105557 [Melampsora larici-populina 98AG31]|uniref:Uncharacterized protein n=1 Tax=Melampsora larici-populina (strain 98AG31 / pathotype 3-4-7) TaxID=747676 RepID=F4RIM0_MELLP|nr:uncharacterized protein MELLADRAFT_105557 [Melampsora larici-populina 98AG31]EGG07810.1 hypothetical protein MELLADRAFT_105557 [Melampsora larici-populina 98AG31]